MKINMQQFKNLFFGTAMAFVAMVALLSCENTNTKDSKEIAQEHNDAKFANDKEDNADLLVNAAEMNLMVAQLGRLAQTKGSIAKVQEVGKTMEEDHNKASEELSKLAQQKQVTIPLVLTEEGLEAHKRLIETNAADFDFDKEYIDLMVSTHKDAIRDFEEAANDSSDPEIRSWASKMLPSLREHLDTFITYQNQLNRM